jgi:hypothetical protein
MSWERKVTANRTNGRKSRGPRTAAGKAKASRNAQRHGLAAKCHLNSDASGQIERITNAICSVDADPLLREQAQIIVQSAVVLHRVQLQNLATLERIRDMGLDATDCMHEALAELTRLARYERRAWSLQKKATRNFMNIKFGNPMSV